MKAELCGLGFKVWLGGGVKGRKEVCGQFEAPNPLSQGCCCLSVPQILRGCAVTFPCGGGGGGGPSLLANVIPGFPAWPQAELGGRSQEVLPGPQPGPLLCGPGCQVQLRFIARVLSLKASAVVPVGTSLPVT